MILRMKTTRADVLPVGPPVQPRFQIGREGTIARLVAELSSVSTPSSLALAASARARSRSLPLST
jgi:hypothetical protein